jgi:hypothetical protein
LGAAAILDPSFQPRRSNTGSKQYPFFVTFLEPRLKKYEREEQTDSRAIRSQHAEELLRFICEILGGQKVAEYVANFFETYTPALEESSGDSDSDSS